MTRDLHGIDEEIRGLRTRLAELERERTAAYDRLYAGQAQAAAGVLSAQSQPDRSSPACERCGATVIEVGLDGQPGQRIALERQASSWYALVMHRGGGPERARPIFAYQEHRCGEFPVILPESDG